MDSLRTNGLSHIYLDENLDKFSNVAIGTLIRALGHNFKIAYFSNEENFAELSDFFEEFNFFNFFSIDIIFELEYKNNFKNFDLLIFDNIDFSKINKDKILNLIKDKSVNTEILFIFSSNNDFNEIQDNFDLVSEYKYTKNKSLHVNKNIINITGNGKGKSTYGFGEIIRNCIKTKEVRLIYFDKGGDFYSERIFFEKLKKESLMQGMTLGFDFQVTGKQRFDGKNFRFNHIEDDFTQAEKGLKLLEHISNVKDRFVVAEELNSSISLNLIKIEDVLDVLKNAKSQILITGRYSPEEITKIAKENIEVIEIKHYSTLGHKVRRGIDF